MTNAYEQLQKDMSTFFSTSEEPTYNLNPNSYFETAYFPKYLKNLPSNLKSATSKKSILDTLRINGSDPNDLGLPKIVQSNELIIYNEQQTTANNQYVIESNENEFANPLIVPQSAISTTTTSTTTITSPTWKLSKLLLGHTGHVTSLTIDPLNKYFMSGSSDKTIKVWDLISGNLQLTLSGHIMAITDMVISPKHPYLFTVSEDKTCKCWDLEKNQVIRNYHGHLSAVYTIDLQPDLNLIVTGGRDSSVRVWDIRTRNAIHILSGHQNSVNKVKFVNYTNSFKILSCSVDSTLKSWDLISGKCENTLTFNSRNIKSFIMNGQDNELITSSINSLKKFKLPDFDYLSDLSFWDNHNIIEQGNLIVNTLSYNNNGVIFGGCNDGKFGFWNWESGTMFQNDIQKAVPGSLNSENGILCSLFDNTGSRLITGNVDKSIRIWNCDDFENVEDND